MLRSVLTKAPLLASLAAILVFLIVAGAGLGLDWPLLLAAAALVFVVAEGIMIAALWKKEQQKEKLLRHFRYIADRQQAVLRSAPVGYCLFTPQGLLREEHDVAVRLGLEKLVHLDELIGAIKDSAGFLENFRALQTSGTAFMQDVHPVRDQKTLRVYGRRFRIGAEGPHTDVLWFYDPSALDVAHFAGAALAAAQKASAPAVAAAPAIATAVTAAPQSQPLPALCEGSGFDALPLPVWARDENLNLVLCNKAFAQALDSTPERILKHQTEWMGASSAAGRTLAAAALSSAQPQVARDHAVVGGKRCLFQVVEQPFVKTQGQETPIALLGFAIDVTAEEEKETELRRHLVSHHEVMEHLSAAICVFGSDTRLEFYNRAYQRLWDSPDSALDAKPTLGDLLEDFRARRRIPEQVDFQKYKKEQLALFTSLLEPREDALYLPDGTTLRVMIAPHPLGGLMFVYENVTDQLELETSYNTLMAVQRETIDNLAEGIAVFGPEGRLRLSNAALADLWGLPKDYLDTEPHVSELFERARPLIDVTSDWESRKAELVGFALHRLPRKGRMGRTDERVVEFLTVPLPDGSVLNSFLNVTDSVKVEQALRASNAALATADRLKSDFVANVSYQLRTPLNTITGFAEILVEQYFGTLNERQMEYTATIKTESEKLSRLINDVLDLATIEAGRMTLDRRPVSVAALLGDAKAMTAEWVRQQSLEIIVDCAPTLGSFEVDEQRVRQILFNLISNAIKYTPAGGHIALAAWEQDEWVVISVLDTGVGIPESDKERIFGKFERANDHLRQSGAGLGLSLVKSFVELHGGRVEIFSDETDGTRISCFFPRKTPPADKLP